MSDQPMSDEKRRWYAEQIARQLERIDEGHRLYDEIRATGAPVWCCKCDQPVLACACEVS